jgi:chromate transport protein ChrA
MSFKIVKYAFVGINVGVSFLIIKTGFSMLKKIEKKIIPISVFLLIFLLLIIFEIFAIKFSSIIFILFGGIIGIIYYSLINRNEVNN